MPRQAQVYLYGIQRSFGTVIASSPVTQVSYFQLQGGTWMGGGGRSGPAEAPGSELGTGRQRHRSGMTRPSAPPEESKQHAGRARGWGSGVRVGPSGGPGAWLGPLRCLSSRGGAEGREPQQGEAGPMTALMGAPPSSLRLPCAPRGLRTSLGVGSQGPRHGKRPEQATCLRILPATEGSP